MTDSTQRERALNEIQENIARYGHHIYVVTGEQEPRFAYTIGVSASLGFELILGGAIFYMLDDVVRIINDIVAKLKSQECSKTSKFEIAELGSFSLREAHPSWVRTLALGALDFYQVSDITACQIVPDAAHWTIDVPNLTEPWSAITAPVWKWLHEPWTYPVPSKSTAATNLGALRGERITEAMRWEEDYWELFAGAGPDISKDDMRVVPLGTLVATDTSLERVLSLPIGEGFWRDGVSGWHPWQKRGRVADESAAQGNG
jgi:hypothetical protein